jgi:hypothetical protein
MAQRREGGAERVPGGIDVSQNGNFDLNSFLLDRPGVLRFRAFNS